MKTSRGNKHWWGEDTLQEIYKYLWNSKKRSNMGYNFKVGDNVYDNIIHKKGIVNKVSLDGSRYPVEVKYDSATLWYSLDGRVDFTRNRQLYHANECEFDSNGYYQRVIGEPQQLTLDDLYNLDFPDLGWFGFDHAQRLDTQRTCSCSTTNLVQQGCKCGAFKEEQRVRKA